MNTVFRYIGDTFLHRRLDFRVRLYNVLAMSGVPIGLAMAVSCVYTKAGAGNILLNLTIAAGSFILLRYSCKTGKYQRCYAISIVVMFLILFPALFFTAGGYRSGMPSFFVFAVLFTVFMLEGKKAPVIAAIEMALYIGVCLIAYYYPETVRPFPTERDAMADVIFGFVAVAICLGITMFLHFRLYNEQQRELEAAKEEALSLSQAKSNFLANMSHEIRTPINVMLGMNEMILRESDSEQVNVYGRNIQNAGKTLLLLINNILDVAKIEAGKLTVVRERYQTAELIDELAMIGAEQAGRYGLAFEMREDGALPGALVGDAIHIRQVVVNFLSNAAKYTKDGGVVLSATQKPGATPDEITLCLSVADTGIGIKAENLPLLFDAFIRADMPSNRYIEGTGLGLAIAKELTGLMGGRIHVESEWGRGSVFSIELPQTVADKTPVSKAPRSAAKELRARAAGFIAPGGKVLVVDDNEENLQVICSLLSRTMLRVDTASSGAECLQAAGKQNYHIILLDYMMPDMDGLQTLKRLRAIPGFAAPVIALTANVVAGVREKLLAAGFREYLSKPVMWRDLEAALLALLPPELITPAMTAAGATLTGDTLTGATLAGATLTPEMKTELARGLSACGVSLAAGLHYLSGDIVQYKVLASFFTRNYEAGKGEIDGFAGREDWAGMKFCVHSLKSKARAVGANTLADTAAKLETLCAAGEGAHIALTLPVLAYEWERARDGLCAFAARLDGLAPAVAEGAGAAAADMDELASLLRHNRQPDALMALDRLIAAERSPATLERLRAIRQKIYDIELREAERLWAELIDEDKDAEEEAAEDETGEDEYEEAAQEAAQGESAQDEAAKEEAASGWIRRL
ncbi:MAG: response regulator [Gracilibacteraceae bacterium]|nr:response regulator [Gracilibacteraceae bacterium]